MYINNSTLNRIGLFGWAEDSTIKNLTVSGNISTSVMADSGGIVGIGGNLIIENCINEATITSSVNTYSVGGIIGSTANSVVIRNSVNKGTISGGVQTGGIVGAGNSGIKALTIENCFNEGKIINNVGQYAGGLIGNSYGTNSKNKITNSYNIGNIIANEGFVGGLIGNTIATIEIVNAYNIGNINSNGYMGGLIGRIYNDSTENIKNGKIINSYNDGNITGGTRAGGLIGMVLNDNNFLIDKCNNKGTIYSDVSSEYGTMVGGLIGTLWNGNDMYILNSYNLGNITSKPDVNNGVAGGLIGQNGDGPNYTRDSHVTILNSYNIGEIIGTQSYTYGISKSAFYLKLNNVYNLGNVTEFDGTTGRYAIGVLNAGNNQITNTYYPNTLIGSNIANDGGTPMNEIDMKNISFVNTLNYNANNMDINAINNELKNAGLINENEKINLVSWKLSNDSYPILDY